MPVLSSHTVHKTENEHVENLVPTGVIGRSKGTITVRSFKICNIAVMYARALSRVVGVTLTAAQMCQMQKKHGRKYRTVKDTEDGESSDKQR